MSNTGLSVMPLQATHHGLLAAATGLRGPVSLTDMRPSTVLEHGIRWLQTTSPGLEKFILITAPFAVALYGAYRLYEHLQLHTLADKIKSLFLGKIIIPHDHQLHGQVLAYFSQNRASSSTRTLTLHQPKHVVFNSARDLNGDNALGTADAKKLAFVPSVGASEFTWQSHRLTLDRAESKEVKVQDPHGRFGRHMDKIEGDLAISCVTMFGGLSVIQEFLAYVQSTMAPPSDATTSIFRISKQLPGDDRMYWDPQPLKKAKRSLDSVALEDYKRDSLVRDIRTYLSPESQKWYQRRGIPWRRGYLCYGPPGTGKTSFATSLAGEFNLHVYIISLSNPQLNDDRLEYLFDQLPHKCLVLLEDVDSAGIQRENMNKTSTKKRAKKNQMFGLQEETSKLSLAGLLNVIDGPTSREGRLLLMTSNSPDNLDPALLRPGRIDRKVLFGNATAEINKKLFARIMGNLDGESIATHTNDQIDALATKFADNIPAEKLTPAEISNFLLEHKDDPIGALEEAGAWAESVIQVKLQGRNVAAFAGQIGPEDSAVLSPDKRKDSAVNVRGQKKRRDTEDSADSDDEEDGTSETGSDREEEHVEAEVFDKARAKVAEFQRMMARRVGPPPPPAYSDGGLHRPGGLPPGVLPFVTMMQNGIDSLS